jgi:zinc transport system ATP-binding protein
MKNKIIEINNLNFENILKDISLEIYEGDFVAIIGSNGGGKSTLIKLLLGILEKSSGTISLFGKPKSEMSSNNQIGYVPQNGTNMDNIFPATVYEIIKTAFAYKNTLFRKISKEEFQYIDYLIDLFDISKLKYNLIAELSGGQKQRVMIVRALANKPKLLILDEPDIALDKKTQEQFINTLKQINKNENTTIIYITHNLELLQDSITKTFIVNQVLK